MNLTRHAVALALLFPSWARGQSTPITIRAGTVLDGRGGIVRNRTIVIEGARIVRLEAAGKTATYDLGRFTVLPGGIDTHVHLTSHFDPSPTGPGSRRSRAPSSRPAATKTSPGASSRAPSRTTADTARSLPLRAARRE